MHCLRGTCLILLCWVKTIIMDLCDGGPQLELSRCGRKRDKKKHEYVMCLWHKLSVWFDNYLLHFIALEFPFDWKCELVTNFHRHMWAATHEDTMLIYFYDPLLLTASLSHRFYCPVELHYFFFFTQFSWPLNSIKLLWYYSSRHGHCWNIYASLSNPSIHPWDWSINNIHLPGFITLIIWIEEVGKKSIS